MELKDIILYIGLVTQLITIIGVIIAVYKFSKDPDIKLDKEFTKMKSECELKHKFIDENIVLIKENHLKHIESDVSNLKQGQARIEAKLDIFSDLIKNKLK